MQKEQTRVRKVADRAEFRRLIEKKSDESKEIREF